MLRDLINSTISYLRKGLDFEKHYDKFGKLLYIRYIGNGYKESMNLSWFSCGKIYHIWINVNGKEVQSYGFTYYEDRTYRETIKNDKGKIQGPRCSVKDLKYRLERLGIS